MFYSMYMYIMYIIQCYALLNWKLIKKYFNMRFVKQKYSDLSVLLCARFTIFEFSPCQDCYSGSIKCNYWYSDHVVNVSVQTAVLYH